MKRRLRRDRGITLMIALALTAGCLCAPQGLAAANEPPTEEDLERAFQVVLADPSNLEASFEYARIAAALGDYEAAVSSLERMLMFNPDLVLIQVELGVLYFRLGSYDAAKTYFDQALAHADLPDDARGRVETFLAEIEAQMSPHRFAFSFSGGLRYQTNANLAPGDTILSGGTPTALPIEFSAEDDFNVFADLRIRHRYDLGTADGDHWETNAGAYTSQQFQVDEFSLTFLDLNTGPLILPSGPDGIAIRPYVKGSVLFLESEYYQSIGGAGLELDIPITAGLSAGLEGYWQYAAFTGSADDLDGHEIRIKADVSYNAGNYGVSLSGEAAHIDADQRFESYQEVGGRVFGWVELPAPVDIASNGAGWTVTLSAEAIRRNYESANPAVSPNVRHDKEYRIDSQLVIPVASSASVFFGAGWQDVRSNLPNFSFDNISALGGFNLRF